MARLRRIPHPGEAASLGVSDAQKPEWRPPATANPHEGKNAMHALAEPPVSPTVVGAEDRNRAVVALDQRRSSSACATERRSSSAGHPPTRTRSCSPRRRSSSSQRSARASGRSWATASSTPTRSSRCRHPPLVVAPRRLSPVVTKARRSSPSSKKRTAPPRSAASKLDARFFSVSAMYFETASWRPTMATRTSRRVASSFSSSFISGIVGRVVTYYAALSLDGRMATSTTSRSCRRSPARRTTTKPSTPTSTR